MVAGDRAGDRPGPLVPGIDDVVDFGPSARWLKFSDQKMMKFGLDGALVLVSMVSSFQVPLIALGHAPAGGTRRGRAVRPEARPSGR